MMMNAFFTTLLLVLSTCCVQGKREIEDPFNIFCGSEDCYDILNLTRGDYSPKEIKKAYRKLALEYHPDKLKYKEVDGDALFVAIAKAAEVLGDREQKDLYDYYLDHPREYYKVTGKYYFRALPKADVRLIIAGVILFFSILLPIVQYQKWQRAVGYLRYATINNLGLKNGGTKETLELFRRAEELFQVRYLEYKQSTGTTAVTSSASRSKSSKNDKIPSGSKMLKDPLFSDVVDEVVGEVKIEGGYSKPTYKDIFAVKLVMFPYSVFNWAKKKYRLAYHESELTVDECRELTVETIGLGTWDDMTPDEQSDAIKRRLWQPGKLAAFQQEKEEEYLRKNPALFKRYQRYKKKEKMG